MKKVAVRLGVGAIALEEGRIDGALATFAAIQANKLKMKWTQMLSVSIGVPTLCQRPSRDRATPIHR